MSQETNVSVKFSVNATQLKQMFKQLSRLNTKIKSMSRGMTKLSKDFKKLDSRFGTASNKSKKFTKALQSQEAKQKRAAAALGKLTKNIKGYTNATKRSTSAGQRGNKTLGFTGLAFGFIGGIAGFAANQIKTQFISVLEDTASILSEINRISLFSDVGIINQAINLDGFNTQLDRTIQKSRQFGISIEDMATLLKEVEKAAPSNIDTGALGDIVAGFKTLESEVDVSRLTSDFATIAANFPELPLEDIADAAFAFSKATKLSFTAGAKSIGFAAQASRTLNTDLDELLRTLATVVAAVPGERGTAGRSIRRFVSGISDPETVALLEKFGITVFDLDDKFVGLERIILQTATTYNKLNEVNQRQASAFLELIGLTENAKTGFLAFARATDESREALAREFDVSKGAFGVAVEDQIKRPESALNRLKNTITELKLEFSTGLFPVLNELNDLFTEFGKDSTFNDTLKQFGQALGENLVFIAQVALPVLKTFVGVFKDNTPAVKLLAGAFIALFIALSTITIVFPILGMFFALIFLHEKLIARSILLGARATFVTKAYVRMWGAITGATSRFILFAKALTARVIPAMTNFFRLIGVKLFAGLASGLRFLTTAFIAIGARAGLFFGAAFNILANAFIGAGAWLKALGVRLAATFGTIGATTGTAFGVGFILAAAAAGAAAGILIAQELEKQLFKGNLFAAAAIDFINLIRPLFGPIIPLIIAAFQGSFDGLIGTSRKTVATIERIFRDLGITDAIFGAFETARNAIVTVGEAIANNMIFAFNKVFSTFFNIGKLIFDTVSDGFASFVEAGKMIALAINQGIKDTLGIDLLALAESIGKLIGSTPETKNNAEEGPGIFEQLADFFAIPDAFAEEIETFVELEKEQNEILKDSNELLDEQNGKMKVFNNLMRTNNIFRRLANSLLSVSNVLIAFNNERFNEYNQLLVFMIEKIKVQISEVIKNINNISALTTSIAGANLMFANLIAQGNRAAGKLASLRVSSTGRFSISDPGISAFDQANINAAASNLASTLANQVFLDQNVEIIIQPLITIENATQEEAEEAANTITDALEDALQRVAPLVAG